MELTADMMKKLRNDFYEDASTEDMDFAEYLKWLGWRYDDKLKNWIKV